MFVDGNATVPGWQIALFTIGIVSTVAMIIAAIVFVIKRRNRKRNNLYDSDRVYTNNKSTSEYVLMTDT